MNIAELLTRAAQQRPNRPAWRFRKRHATYAQFTSQVGALAHTLHEHGLRPGDRIVIHMPNGPELIETLCASFWAGYVAVPVNWHLHADEITYIFANCDASALFSASPHAQEVVLARNRSALCVSTTPGAGSVEYSELSGIGPSQPTPTKRDGGDAAWLFYTSGTTGAPKGATLSHRNLVAMTLNYLSDIDTVGPEAVFLHAAPLTHGSGLYLLPAMARAATNVLLDTPRFDPAACLATIEEHHVTHCAFLAPTMLKRLTDHGNPAGHDLSTLRSIVVGGGPLYASDLRAAQGIFGPVITQIYGQGEAPMTITAMGATDPGASTRPESAGRPFTGVSVQVRDGAGTRAAAGVAGEIYVRGDVVMRGYWNNSEATAAALPQGWLRTGDIGFFDDAGYLYLTDRAKDVIITGGSNVYPREVEEVLIRHPSVAEASVIGVPDKEWGESVCAVIVAAAEYEVSEQQLVEHCQRHLASFKKPRRFIITDSLPKNAAGKVLKRQLRDIAADMPLDAQG